MRADLDKPGYGNEISGGGGGASLAIRAVSDLLEAELDGSGVARPEAAGEPGAAGVANASTGVLGWFCTYTPEEILLAAGLDSRRIFGTFNPVRSADIYLGSNLCPYVRSCLEGAIKGRYGALDGAIMTTSCNAMCHLYNAWRRARAGSTRITGSIGAAGIAGVTSGTAGRDGRTGGGFCYMLNVPRLAPQAARVQSRGRAWVVEEAEAMEDLALNYWERELRRLIQELSSRFGAAFSDEGLYNAIRTCNETRELLHSVYLLNKANGCYGCGRAGAEVEGTAGREGREGLAGPEARGITIAGTDLMKIVKMSMSYPKSRFNAALRRILARLSYPYLHPQSVTPGQSTPRPGVLVAGSVCDAPVIEIIEDAGARVVADDLCTGMRYFDGQVDLDEAERSGNFVRAIARRYLNKPPCARMYHASSRFEHVYDLVREFDAKGIIFYGLKFCDPYLYDHIGLRRRFEERGIPVLLLEGDYTAGGAGQARTRVEAFVEMIS